MFLKAGSGCGQDRVSGCRGAGAGGTGRESGAAVTGTGAAWDLRAASPRAGVLIEPGCPGQQRGKPGSTAFLPATRVLCQPAWWPSLPCQL